MTVENLPLLTQAATELRYLCADIVEHAKSGHPGAPMGLAEAAIVLSHHLHLNPKNPTWLNRDRLVFSGGHVSALVYALLHLWGFDVSLDDLRAFRTLDSKTPGHPEFPHTQGVEITTGPLGQGIANAVGFAMGTRLASHIIGADIFTHNVYCFCGDGDLQEGISYEACALAGVHKLHNLIILYDSNHITIDGDTSMAWDESIQARFEAQGFEVFSCCGHDLLELDAAITSAKASTLPSIIIMHTTIGKGALELEGSHKTHGAPLGANLIERAKKSLNLSPTPFFISEEVAYLLRACMEKGASVEALWEASLTQAQKATLQSLASKTSTNTLNISYPSFPNGNFLADVMPLDASSSPSLANNSTMPTPLTMATRTSNGKILNAIAQALPNFIGGSADLASSNNTTLHEAGIFPQGRNIHFGVREHAMGAICNALANYGLFLPFCATFFVFSDYMSASIRLASLMKARVFYIFTHDSIGVGEDGATHEPIEQLSHLRAIPNLLVFRPADAHENIACWQVALASNVPCAFILTRQEVPLLASVPKEYIAQGAYIKRTSTLSQEIALTLLASGSEVALCLQAQRILESSGIATQVISMPCFELLCKLDEGAKSALFRGYVLAVEAARGLELYRFAHHVLGMENFGKSARGDILFKHFGFSAENIAHTAKTLLHIN